MSVLARQQAQQSGNLPPLEFPSARPLTGIPKKPFTLPNVARATADARRSGCASADGHPGLQCHRRCMATRRGRQQSLTSRL